MQFSKSYNYTHPILLLFLMHIAGVIGMNLPLTSNLFLSLSSINLLASGLIVFLHHENWSLNFIRTVFIFCLVGYGVEVIGTNFGIPFGQYTYGDALGLSAFGVPLIMGLTWGLLLYSTAIVAYTLFERTWARVLFASFLMVFTDFFIEPLAGKLDYWHWAGGHAPLINFVGWYFISLLLHSLFFAQGLGEKNKVALLYYPILTVFFILLNLLL